MYDELAPWWPLLSPPAEYEEEAALFLDVLTRHVPRPASLLELGSGGGHNAYHMKKAFAATTLVDLSPAMLEVSRALNPELAHIQGDMRSVRLEQVFDAVFIHDAISHMTSREDLRRALRTAAEHLRPGGLLLVVPDETRESFVPSESCGGSDDPRTGRGMRYLEWTYDPDPDDEQTTTEYAYLLRAEDGSVRTEHDRHHAGLFPRQVWLDTLRAVGLEARGELCRHSEVPKGIELFVGVKPAG